MGLHGHVRATKDLNVYVPEPVSESSDALIANGYSLDAKRREFRRAGIPVQIVTDEQTGGPPSRICTIRRIQTVGLADLINMKLRSGRQSVRRAQDIADVIVLIRVCKPTSAYAGRIDRAQRGAYSSSGPARPGADSIRTGRG